MMKRIFLTILAISVMPFMALAEESWLSSIDKAINEKVEPVANWWEGFVLSSFSIAGVDVPLVLVILIGGASFVTVYFGFVNLRKIPFAIQVVRGKYDFVEKQGAEDFKPDDEAFTNEGDIPETVRDESRDGEVNHFQALTAAVSATVGLGNIAGVAIAIGIGGPGATMWMIIAGLLGMSSKFVECTLGVKYRFINSEGRVFGGPMNYLRYGLEKQGKKGLGKFLAVFFAILAIGASFGGGNMFQANQSFVILAGEFPMLEGNGFIFGIVVAILVGIVIIGGISSIARVTGKVVPIMAAIYILGALVVIGVNI